VAAPIVAMSHVFVRSVPDAAYVTVYSFGPANDDILDCTSGILLVRIDFLQEEIAIVEQEAIHWAISVLFGKSM
jgi:hypothetical protein